MRKRIISALQYLFFLLIGLALLWLVFRKLDLEKVMEEIRNAHYQWLFLSFFFGILSHIARAKRWNILIRSMGYQTSATTTFYAVMIGYLANSAFPRLGEVTRCGVLAKKTDTPFNALFGTVISERIFDLIILILIILSVILFQLDLLKNFVDKYFIESLSGMMETRIILYGIAAFFIIVILPIILFRIYIHRIRQLRIYQRLSVFLKGLLDGVRTIGRIKEKWAFLLWTAVIWTFYILMTYVAFFALDATSHLNFLDGMTLMALGSVGIVAPVPGGIGAYQFVVKAILVEIYHVASEPAASFSIILWSTQMVLILSAGVFSYYMLMFKKKPVIDVNTTSN